MNSHRVLQTQTCSEPQGEYVLYWMQRSQRIQNNYSLSHATYLSNHHQVPLVVFFGVTDYYPDANLRHYHFMLSGLKELQTQFASLNISFVIGHVSPEKGCLQLMKHAIALVMDAGYTYIERKWRQWIYDHNPRTNMTIAEVEGDVVVPIKRAYPKASYSARILRPKIMSQMKNYLDETSPIEKQSVPSPIQYDINFKIIDEPMEYLDLLDLDRSVQPSTRFISGENAALNQLKAFLDKSLSHYLLRNHPEHDYCSFLSPYLHFGQISPVTAVNAVLERLTHHAELDEAVSSFIEELVVRRELAFNYVYYIENYHDFQKMTEPWAYDTMDIHVADQRDYLYSLEDFETYNTHDPYWNAAMKEMVTTGFMHTYMRMYWCKKIIEWSIDYRTAYETALYLNNKYFLDGRDPNSYAGVAWCFGKHDRPWTERPVFGKLRYMNANGLKRKFDIDTYVNRHINS